MFVRDLLSPRLGTIGHPLIELSHQPHSLREWYLSDERPTLPVKDPDQNAPLILIQTELKRSLLILKEAIDRLDDNLIATCDHTLDIRLTACIGGYRTSVGGGQPEARFRVTHEASSSSVPWTRHMNLMKTLSTQPYTILDSSNGKANEFLRENFGRAKKIAGPAMS